MAVGVASPKAQGQAITKTAMKIDNAKTPVSPANNQANEEIMASPITIGTKYDEIISAILAIGAFCP